VYHVPKEEDLQIRRDHFFLQRGFGGEMLVHGAEHIEIESGDEEGDVFVLDDRGPCRAGKRPRRDVLY
jgi:hypothetical protein